MPRRPDVASLRSPGATWGAVENVGAPGSATAEPHAAVTSNGIPVVAWGSAGQNGAVAHGSHRTDGGWHPVELGTPSRDDASGSGTWPSTPTATR